MADLKNIKVLKIGALIPTGSYSEPHNRFNQVLNFPVEDKVVSLCSASLSPGPYRIILSANIVEDIHNFSLSESELILNGEISLAYTSQQLYRQPRVFAAIPGFSKESLIRKLIGDMVNQEWATLLSMITGSCRMLSAFDKELQKSLLNALAALWQDNTLEFVTRLKGRGIGSTPSGDDFIIGYLLGISWLEKAWGMDLQDQREIVYSNALGTNKLVNTFLHQAYSYQLDKNWADFLNCLAANLVNRIDDEFSAVALQGETSGEDMLSGFFISILWNRRDSESSKTLANFS